MRNTEKSFLLILAIFMTLGFIGGLDPTAWPLCIAAIILFGAYVGLTSVGVIQTDKMLAAFVLGSYERTYVNRTFREKQGRGDLGLIRTDFWCLLDPIFRGVFFPTTFLRLHIHATRIYTRGTQTHPSIPVKAFITLYIQLGTDLALFVQAINVLGKGRDLAVDCDVQDNEYDPAKSPGDPDNLKHSYKGKLLTQILLDALENVILQAARTVGVKYTWGGAGDDIRVNRPEFEKEMRAQLVDDPNSIFLKAGLLTRDGQEGPAVLSFDFNIDDIELEDKDTQAALSAPMRAELEADAAERRGDGEGRRLKKIADHTGMKGDEVFQGETLRSLKEVTLIGAGERATDVVRSLIRKITGN